MKQKKPRPHSSFLKRVTALTSALALLITSFAAVSGQSMKPKSAAKTGRLSEDQRILHVLNRLGFGARPGDVERVKSIGLDKYIEQQLHPDKIDDTATEAKLQNLTALRMTTPELYEKYPQPGQLLRALQQRGALPQDLAAARDNRQENRANTQNPNQPKTGESMSGEMQGPPRNPANPNADANPMNNAEYRRAVYAYFKENNLRPPQFITGELQMSRILRATYSERQLQEVMVDFWTNHFNVFSGKGADRWLLISYDRDSIRPHTMGKFQDLLRATAESPAMLFYLDNFQSVSPDAQQQQRPAQMQRPGQVRRIDPSLIRMSNNPQQQMPQQTQGPRRGINENYARELM